MKKLLLTILVLFISCSVPIISKAADRNHNMTTITVDASDDESGSLKYAIDSDDPASFGDSNEFVVEAGSSHTVYVKDAAGNISGQVISAPIEKVGIEVTIGQDGTDSAIAAASASSASEHAETGGGTVSEKTVTDGTVSSEKIFYTITTPDENVFYMVIDNTRTTDNVYLLNQVTEEDLLGLAKGADAEQSKESIFQIGDNEMEENALAAEEQTPEAEEKPHEKSDIPIIIAIMVIVGGVYYYLKVYKTKKAAEMDLADAMDIDEFEAEEEEEDELYFEETEAKERLLKKITNDTADVEEIEPGTNIYEELDSESSELLDTSLEDIDKEIEERHIENNKLKQKTEVE